METGMELSSCHKLGSPTKWRILFAKISHFSRKFYSAKIMPFLYSVCIRKCKSFFSPNFALICFAKKFAEESENFGICREIVTYFFSSSEVMDGGNWGGIIRAIYPSAPPPAYGPAQVYNCKAYDTSLPPLYMPETRDRTPKYKKLNFLLTRKILLFKFVIWTFNV